VQFTGLVKSIDGKDCLQIGVEDDVDKKYGKYWKGLGRYDDQGFIGYRYDINDLKFANKGIDIVDCISILEHVPDSAPKDHWRVTPDGLRGRMKSFEEIACGAFF